MQRMRMAYKCIAVATFLVLASCGGSGERQASLGDTHMRLGNFDQALAAYTEAVAADPELVSAHLGRARSLELLGRTQDAAAAYRAAVAIPSAPPAAFFEAATLFQREGLADEARGLAENLAARDAQAAEMLHAELDIQAGRYTEALKRLEALTQAPSPPETAWLALARAHTAAGNLDAAQATLERLLNEVNPESIAARVQLVEIFSERGKLDEMIEQLQALEKERPASQDIQVGLARAFLSKGDLPEAEARARAALKEDPSNGWANFVLGRCLLAQGETSMAANALQAAFRALPGEPGVAAALARLQSGGTESEPEAAQAGSPGPVAPPEAPAGDEQPTASWRDLWRRADLATLLRSRAVHLDAGGPEARAVLATAALVLDQEELATALVAEMPEDYPVRQAAGLAAQGDLEGALQAVTRWEPADDLEEELRFNLRAHILSKGGARGAAFETLAACLDRFPEGGAALYNLATVFNVARQTELQIQVLKQLVRRHPANLEAHLLLFEILRAEQRLEDARNQAEVTFSQFSNSPEALTNLARIYHDLGDGAAARAVLASAIKRLPEADRLRILLARLLLDAGQGAEMPEVLAPIAEGDPLYPARQLILAIGDALDGQFASARALWEDAKADSPPLPLRLVAAAAFLREGDSAGAAQALSQGMPDGAPTLDALRASLGLETAPLADDGRNLAALLEQDPARGADLALSLACLQASLPTAALPILRALDAQLGAPLSLAPLMFQALGRAQIEGPRMPQVLTYAQQHADSPNAWLSVAAIARVENDAATRSEALDKAWELAPGDFGIGLQRALYLSDAGAGGELEKLYRRLLEIESDSAIVKNNLAYHLLDSGGSAQEALDLAQQAHAKLGDQVNVLHTLGLAQLRLGRPAEALESLQKAVEIRPGDPTLMFDLGRALAATGDESQGNDLIQNAILYSDQMGIDFPRRAEAVQALAE